MILKNLFNHLTLFGRFNLYKSLIYGFGFGSLSFILIALNVLGKHQLAISVGLIQSAIYIITIGLSSNYRSLALSEAKTVKGIGNIRTFFSIIFLFVSGIFLLTADLKYTLVLFFLIMRKVFDWIEEIFIFESFEKNKRKNLTYFFIQLAFLIYFPFVNFENKIISGLYLVFWNISTFYIFKSFYIKNIRTITHNLNFKFFYTSFFGSITLVLATLIPTLVNYFYRLRIFKTFDVQTAASIISTLSLGGIFTSFLVFVFMPDFVNILKDETNKRTTIFLWVALIAILYSLFTIIVYFFSSYLEGLNINFSIFCIAITTGFFYLMSNAEKTYQIQKYHTSSFHEEVTINFIILCLIVFAPSSNVKFYFVIIPLIGSLVSFFIYDLNKFILDKNNIKRIFLYLFLLFTILASQFFILISHLITDNIILSSLKFYALLVFLPLTFIAIFFIKLITKKDNLLGLELIFILSWFVFLNKYLNVLFLSNYIYVTYFTLAAIGVYIYHKLCHYINIRFLANSFLLYNILCSVFLAF